MAQSYVSAWLPRLEVGHSFPDTVHIGAAVIPEEERPAATAYKLKRRWFRSPSPKLRRLSESLKAFTLRREHELDDPIVDADTPPAKARKESLELEGITPKQPRNPLFEVIWTPENEHLAIASFDENDSPDLQVAQGLQMASPQHEDHCGASLPMMARTDRYFGSRANRTQELGIPGRSVPALA